MSFSKHFKVALLCAASVAALSSAARGADAVIEAAPSGYNWSGFYIGFGVGAGAVVHGLELGTGGGSGELDGLGGEGIFGEVTAGYDYMVTDRFLVGGFIDANFGNIGPTLEVSGGGTNLDISIENDYGFDAIARLGYVLTPSTLGYVLGGYSYQHFKLDGVPGFDYDTDLSGYVLGVGMETSIAGNWTLKTEYRYADYGTKDFDFEGLSLGIKPSTHTFHVGANYRFGAQNGGGAAIADPGYNWTGFFLGGALGAGAVVYDLGLGLGGGSADLNGLGGEGVFGELNAGYDYDFGSFVAGVMIDGSVSGIESKLTIGGSDIATLDAKYGFDLLARIGAKVNESTLAYIIGGYSYQHFEAEASIVDFSHEEDLNGFSVGGGLEAAMSSNVSLNLEYRYSQYESADFDLGGASLSIEPSFHTVRIGAKYKFN